MRGFTVDQGDDAASPHSYANKRRLRDVRMLLKLPADADLAAVDAATLRATAAAELRADTARRKAPKPAG
ncbi:hypothetical protein [Sphingomonas sp. UYAg733]